MLDYVKVELPYDKINSFKETNPFTTAFCRTEKKGNVLVVGGIHDVDKYIEDNLGNCLVVKTYWMHGNHRTASPQLYGNNIISRMHITSGEFLKLYKHNYMVSVPVKKFNLVNNRIVFASWNRIPSTYPKCLKGL